MQEMYPEKRTQKNVPRVAFITTPHGRGWQPLGDEILMSTGTSCHFYHLLQVSKKSLWSLILYNQFFFHDFIQPPGDKVLMSTEMSCHFIHLLQKHVFEVWFYTFFYDLIQLCSPWQGQTAPKGQNFDVNRNFLSLQSSVASFKS